MNTIFRTLHVIGCAYVRLYKRAVSDHAEKGPINSKFAALSVLLKPKASRYVVILSNQRTGSTLICDMLSQIDGVETGWEALNNGFHKVLNKNLKTNLIIVYLQIFSKLAAGNIFVFKVFPEHLSALDIEVSDLQSALPVVLWIHLYRENLLAQYVSLERAKKTMKWLETSGNLQAKPVEIELNESEYSQFKLEIINYDSRAYRSIGISEAYMKLSYEDLVSDPDSILRNRVLPMLALNYSKKFCQNYRKQGPENITDNISNKRVAIDIIAKNGHRHPGLCNSKIV